MARGSYGERMREKEHLTDQENWRRNMESALALHHTAMERIKELVIDGLNYEYDFGEFDDHPQIQEIRYLLNR